MKKIILCTIFAIFVTATAYAQNETVTFTYEEALALALQDIVAVQDMYNTIAELKDYIADLRYNLRQLDEFLWLMYYNADFREFIESMRDSIDDTNAKINYLNQQQDLLRLSREARLRRAIVAVAEIQLQIYTAQENLQRLNENLRRATVLYEFGRAGSADIRTAGQAVSLAEFELNILLSSHESAQNSLNHILHQPLYQHTIVAFLPYLTDIPSDFANIITPHIYQLQIGVVNARDARRAYRGYCRYTIAELREAYDRAVLVLSQAQTTLETAARQALNEFSSLSAQKEALYTQLYHANAALEVAQTRYRLGRITSHDVTVAQIAVFRIGRELETVLNQKWLLSFLLANPVLFVS